MSKSKDKSIFNSRQNAFLRMLSGSLFNIESGFASRQLNKVLAFQEIDVKGETDVCDIEKAKTMNVQYFSMKGKRTTLEDTTDKYAIVSQSGVMMLQDAMCQYGINTLDSVMRDMYVNESIKGIVLKMHTGGGYSIAGDVLQNTIADKNKPVVVYTTFLASAGIKGTLRANEIIAASEGTGIGSIGTMATVPKWLIGMSEDDMENVDLYSKTSERKNEVYRSLISGDTSLIVEDLTKHDELFMNSVEKYRKLKGSQKTISETLSGAMFTSVDAKKRGLIDGIGSQNYAVRRLLSIIKNN